MINTITNSKITNNLLSPTNINEVIDLIDFGTNV